MIIVLKFRSCIPTCVKDSLCPSFTTLIFGLEVLIFFFMIVYNLILSITPKAPPHHIRLRYNTLIGSIIQVTFHLTFCGVRLVALKIRHGNWFHDEGIILGLVVLSQFPQLLVWCNINYWAARMAASRQKNNLVQHAEVTWGREWLAGYHSHLDVRDKDGFHPWFFFGGIGYHV